MALASVDGRLIDAAEAVVPATDVGLLRGDGVFEVARVYGGRPFALDEHLARMERSAAHLRIPVDVAAVRSDVVALLAAAGPADAAVRMVVTGGGRRVVLLEALAPRRSGTALALVEYVPSRVLDGAKSLSYAANMLAGRIAREQGADEALLVTPHGRILEAPTAALFYAYGGRLCTPPLSDRVLDSITRRRLLALVDAAERTLTTDELTDVSEAFLASTTREVEPVARIAAHRLDPEGPLGREAARRFSAHVAGELAGGAGD